MNLCDIVRSGHDIQIKYFYKCRCKRCNKIFFENNEEYSLYLTKENIDKTLEMYEDLPLFQDDFDDDYEPKPIEYSTEPLSANLNKEDSYSILIYVDKNDRSDSELCPDCQNEVFLRLLKNMI